MKEYNRIQTIIANIPYAAMVLLGAVTISYGSSFAPFALTAAGFYIIYGVIGSIWTMVFICPYCAYYDSRQCPCGYGVISARFVRKGEGECFSEKFKRHIPVIVPLWLIPLVWGLTALWYKPSWILFSLILAFVINSYLILPLVSRKHSCSECPQKDDCPWMGVGTRKGAKSQLT